ncbi:putative protein T-ENOL [Sorex fumeus]|uniref:putative protein T-ENOL n=1 Tax=Sorex fumeus TaxID=62283 RepID=UPI0024ADF714|nr:putative protein T-ENOL [Sorex fumeus]
MSSSVNNMEEMSRKLNFTTASVTPKVSLSRSEEYLTRISTELTNEALFMAGCNVSPEPTNKKQTQDQGTQIPRQAFFTNTRGTDTRSDRNRTRSMAHLLPFPRDKGALPSNLTSGG